MTDNVTRRSNYISSSAKWRHDLIDGVHFNVLCDIINKSIKKSQLLFKVPATKLVCSADNAIK